MGQRFHPRAMFFGTARRMPRDYFDFVLVGNLQANFGCRFSVPLATIQGILVAWLAVFTGDRYTSATGCERCRDSASACSKVFHQRLAFNGFQKGSRAGVVSLPKEAETTALPSKGLVGIFFPQLIQNLFARVAVVAYNSETGCVSFRGLD